MLPEQLNDTLTEWAGWLHQYSLEQLCMQPGPGKWSMGQLYTHLVNDTGYYIEQISECLRANDHASEAATPAGKDIFLNNGFPDAAIEGHPDNAKIPQPDSKEELLNGLLNLKTKLKAIAADVSASPFQGKTRHPGLGYLNAGEWLRLAEMHFRHHTRQKKRIDNFLGQ